MMYEVSEKEQWDAVLSRCEQYDCYHTFDYHAATVPSDSQAVLFHWQGAETEIALPLVIQPIPGTDKFDCTSVYGLGGPVCSAIGRGFDSSVYLAELEEYLASRGIVTVFSRLHPYIDSQRTVLAAAGDVQLIGDVVNIPLDKPDQEVIGAYGKTLKLHLRRLQRRCSVHLLSTDAELREFVEIYHQTMSRAGADESYFFSFDYFRALLDCTEFESEILLIREDDTGIMVSGAMFMKTGKIVEYHVSGMRAGYESMSGTKFAIEAMRERASLQGYHYLNLGGGVGGADDSLLRFKLSFSKEVRQFSVWKHVVDKACNDELTGLHANQSLHDDARAAQSNRFPAYR